MGEDIELDVEKAEAGTLTHFFNLYCEYHHRRNPHSEFLSYILSHLAA